MEASRKLGRSLEEAILQPSLIAGTVIVIQIDSESPARLAYEHTCNAKRYQVGETGLTSWSKLRAKEKKRLFKEHGDDVPAIYDYFVVHELHGNYVRLFKAHFATWADADAARRYIVTFVVSVVVLVVI